MLIADFRAYLACQERIDAAYGERAAWTRKALLNTAQMGHFSADLTIRGYADDIWNVHPLCVVPPSV